MAKGEGRGVRKYLPSIPLIVRVLVALVVLRLVLTAAGASVPQAVRYYLPNL
jgi:hypothetical protein